MLKQPPGIIVSKLMAMVLQAPTIFQQPDPWTNVEDGMPTIPGDVNGHGEITVAVMFKTEQRVHTMIYERAIVRGKGYADVRVTKSKEEYTRAQWQLDAHAFWRSSGDRPFGREDLEKVPTSKLQILYRKFSRENVYSYDEHVKLAESLDKDGRLPSTFMVVAPGSWDMTVWDDINRMKTLNTSQSQRRQQMHVCPLQIDIVERLINRYSNPGDLVADPFAGLFTVPYEAVKMGRVGKGVELNPDYFRDGVGYLEAADAQQNAPTLFDLLESMEGA